MVKEETKTSLNKRVVKMRQSNLEIWIKEEKLNSKERRKFCWKNGYRKNTHLLPILFRGIPIVPNPTKCEYDGSTFELYRKYRKKNIPEDAKDLGILEWHIFGKCLKCKRERQLTNIENEYRIRGIII